MLWIYEITLVTNVYVKNDLNVKLYCYYNTIHFKSWFDFAYIKIEEHIHLSTYQSAMSNKAPNRIQKAFINIVNEMIKHGVNLPDEFGLYYVITEHYDRRGSMVNIN